MSTRLHWTNGPWRGRLALSARPRGGDWLSEEMAGWKAGGVDGVVSLLEPDETADLDLTSEGTEVRRHGMSFRNIPLQDRGVPDSLHTFSSQLETIENDLESGKNLVLHCRQGVGRTGLTAACLFIMHGIAEEDAVKRLSEARGIEVPETTQQREWLRNFGARFAMAR